MNRLHCWSRIDNTTSYDLGHKTASLMPLFVKVVVSFFMLIVFLKVTTHV